MTTNVALFMGILLMTGMIMTVLPYLIAVIVVLTGIIVIVALKKRKAYMGEGL